MSDVFKGVRLSLISRLIPREGIAMDRNLKIGDTVFFKNGLEIRKGVILSLQERTCKICPDENNDKPYVVFKSNVYINNPSGGLQN